MKCSILVFCLPACFGQTTAADPYLKNDLTAGFRYEVKLGQNSYRLGNAPGYGLRYSHRPLRWLELEAGLEQIPRPIGGSVCCEYVTDANDELFLVPFGARYVLEPRERRIRLSAGGGGAYMNHTISKDVFPDAPLASTTGWGGQLVAAGDYGLTRSGRLRMGVTGRFYYIHVGPFQKGRILTVGPDFTFSFR
jgi:hypothetical protein